MIEIPERTNQKGRSLGLVLGGQNGRTIIGFSRGENACKKAGLEYGDEIRKVYCTFYWFSALQNVFCRLTMSDGRTG